MMYKSFYAQINLFNKCSRKNIDVGLSHEDVFIQRLEKLLGILNNEISLM